MNENEKWFSCKGTKYIWFDHIFVKTFARLSKLFNTYITNRDSVCQTNGDMAVWKADLGKNARSVMCLANKLPPLQPEVLPTSGTVTITVLEPITHYIYTVCVFSVKCYRGGQKNHFIPLIFGILPPEWLNYVQYFKRDHMSPVLPCYLSGVLFWLSWYIFEQVFYFWGGLHYLQCSPPKK